MITVKCACGEPFHVEERHRGSSIRCRRCGSIVTIPVASVAPQNFHTHDAVRPEGPSSAAPASGRSHPRRSLRWLAVASALFVVLFTVSRLWPDRSALSRRPIASSSPSVVAPPSSSLAASEPPQVSGDERLGRLERNLCERLKSSGRLPNGSRLLGPRSQAGGQLTIDNGTSHDAAVFLVIPRTATIAGVYVRAREHATLRSIPDGNYQVQFAFGSGWMRTQARFCDPVDFLAFDSTFTFGTRRAAPDTVGDSVFTSILTTAARVTLHPVPEGNARTHSTPQTTFAPGLTGTAPHF